MNPAILLELASAGNAMPRRPKSRTPTELEYPPRTTGHVCTMKEIPTDTREEDGPDHSTHPSWNN